MAEFGIEHKIGSRCCVGSVDATNSGGYLLGSFVEEAEKQELRFETCEVGILELPETDNSKPYYHEIMTERPMLFRTPLMEQWSRQESNLGPYGCEPYALTG